MDILIDPDSPAALSSRIYEAIRRGILESWIDSGDRLPPSPDLVATLDVSRHTLTTAYGHGAAESFLDGRRGAGTVVSDLLTFREPDAGPEPVLDLPGSESIRASSSISDPELPIRVCSRSANEASCPAGRSSPNPKEKEGKR